MSIKKEYYNQLDSRREFTNLFKFSNIFGFIQFCYENHITKDNSITEYDEEENCMYMKTKHRY